LRWYIAYKVKVGLDEKETAPLDLSRARKTEAEARLAEIELAQAEGRLLPLEEYERELSAICEKMRSVLMTVPSKYMGRIQIARSDLEAQAVGEHIRDEMLVALQGQGDAAD
jgi:phage terminase Nu1 subunit (DNA packaging protein)